MVQWTENNEFVTCVCCRMNAAAGIYALSMKNELDREGCGMWCLMKIREREDRTSHQVSAFTGTADVQSCGRVLELIWETTKIEKWSRLALDREKGWGRN